MAMAPEAKLAPTHDIAVEDEMPWGFVKVEKTFVNRQ